MLPNVLQKLVLHILHNNPMYANILLMLEYLIGVEYKVYYKCYKVGLKQGQFFFFLFSRIFL